MAEELFELLLTARWQVGGKDIRFPVENLTEVYANRLVPHKRVYRDGARVDDTHGDPVGWEISCAFYNSADHEAGVDGENLYPRVLNDLCDSFKVHETGTLTLPTRGQRRCRAHNYRREESSEWRDYSAVVFVFMEDNEDDAAVAAFQAPSASALVKKVAADAVRALLDDGGGPDLVSSINELASSVDGYINAPFEAVSDVEAAASAVSHAVEVVGESFAKREAEAREEVETVLSAPQNSRGLRLARRLADTVHRAAAERAAQQPRRIPVRFDTVVSLFQVSAESGVPLDVLLKLNPALDPMGVPANTPVLVPEQV